MKLHELLKQINDAWNKDAKVLYYEVFIHGDYDERYDRYWDVMSIYVDNVNKTIDIES